MLSAHFQTAFVVSLLQTVSWFCNKYVLTVLNFKYPMVFQGWQTLVGFLVLKFWTSSLLPGSLRPSKGITPLDKAGFVSLFPSFLFFTVSLITGSKALRLISIPEYAVGSTFIPAGIFLFAERKNFSLQKIASVIVSLTSLTFGLYGFFSSSPMDGYYSPYFWLLVHVVCNLAASLHGQISDARYSNLDRLYYGYVFSFIVLAPASVYLEEAFEALRYQHRRQVRFLLGSLISGIAGSMLNTYLCTFGKKSSPAGIVIHIGTLVATLFSLLVFQVDALPSWAWVLVVLNLISHLFVPTHFGSEDDEESSSSTMANEDTLKEVLLP